MWLVVRTIFIATTATTAHISTQGEYLNGTQLDPEDIIDTLDARRLRSDNHQSSAEFLAQALLLTPPKVQN